MPAIPRFAVFGHPVAHSQSPLIHAEFGRQLGIALRYEAIEAPPENFPRQVEEFRTTGGAGANVTLPLKGIACDLCRELGHTARAAEAVNTLTRIEGGWRGDNTDGSGLLRDLSDRRRVHIRGRRALLLGAGGAGRAVAMALLDASVDELVIVNRSAGRADRLADAIGDPERAHSRYWEDLSDAGNFQLIVNATSLGHQSQHWDLPPSLVGPRCLCYDLNYGAASLGFMAWARGAGATWACDGLGMLVEQAADAFEIWHGRRPDTEPVYRMLREQRLKLPGND